MTAQAHHALASQNTRSRFGRVVDILFNSFLRILAILYFAGAIYTWLTVVGYWEGAPYRFDTMSIPLKIYSAVMAVMLPVASVGLWTTLPWGRVIWFFAIAFQSVSLMRFGDVMGLPNIVLLFHLVALAIYVMFQLLLYFIDKKA